MENRRSTRIPRPGAALKAAPLAPLSENQENTAPLPSTLQRKRKDISPAGKSGPLAKRATVTSTAAAPSGRPPAVPVPAEDNIWEAVAEETGWTLTDCLSHKVAFAKRADAKSKVEALAQHVKRLRAAGWHLYDARERAAMDGEAMAASLAREEAARKEDREAHDAALRQVQQQLGSLGQEVKAREAEVGERQAEVERLQSELTAARDSLREAQEAARTAAADSQRFKEQAEELASQQKALSEMQQQAQKYNAELQQYNSKMQGELQAANEALAKAQADKAALAEECAALKGRVTALEEQLAAVAATSSTTEQMRASALEDASRLRGEIAGVAAERNAMQAENVRLRGELEAAKREVERFRDATGKDVGALEAENAARNHLESRSKAQAELNTNLHEQVVLLREQKELSEARAEKSAAEVKKLTAKVKKLEKELAAAERKVSEGEAQRRRLHNQIQELKGNIRVFARVRPAKDSEAAEAAPGKPVVGYPSAGDLLGRGLELRQPAAGGGPKGGSSSEVQAHTFGFDRVFAPTAAQGEVFEEISQLVQSALDGYKVCIFAYGQTGSGKTHTMMGSPEDPGMIPRAMDQVFAHAKELAPQGWKYEMKAAMLEIYNEELRDLLGKGPPKDKKHAVSHDKESTSVSYLEYFDVSQPERVAALLERAMKTRSVGATAMNEQSSRSHMVFILAIEGSNEGMGQKVKGQLNLIDLAGSERLSRSAVTGDRLKETQAINKSLSALGDVIAALGNKEAHVPYRNSKLTFLLQNSLGGYNSKTLMFVNIAPGAESAQESLCSLRFAAKVNACEIGTAKRSVTTGK
ncbi:kinesin-3 isoform X2 [Chlorella sorokiniana]|uniref:Kinesin-like protein n=1 Tax=Chlorella sorokiniana TaxID=3076 RepID=A0A2P6TGE0_CHLSO|nr:kinesin-3 isoform X2 [Chlorella sorokiniana]|eukprot:PRW33188.1 kinesin-3 isoform X2 [Chlorella sorokiniana]